MKYITTIGLEVHIELLSDVKMFCKCRANFGDKPNTNVCPICLAIPGTLPYVNNKVIELAIITGIAINCYISDIVSFDRKYYFYKDLPKGYQTTQFFTPLCRDGYIDIQNKRISIREMHIEEDAGKVYIDKQGRECIDYNRAGIPLLEIVTNPDFENADEVIQFLEKLREILIFTNVSDGKIQEGSMRVDINLSVRKLDDNILGNRVEIKNVGSFKAIRNAIEYEQIRQISILEARDVVNIETRRFSEDENKTIFMRYKELAKDYLYHNDEDILHICLGKKFIENIKNSMPILPEEKRKFYLRDYNLSLKDIDNLLLDPYFSYMFDELNRICNKPKEIVNLITGEFFKILKDKTVFVDRDKICLKDIAKLIDILYEGNITRSVYKEVFYKVVVERVEPLHYIESNNLYCISDENVIRQCILKVLTDNSKSVADYKNGKQKALKFLIGKIVKEFSGRVDTSVVERLILENI